MTKRETEIQLEIYLKNAGRPFVAVDDAKAAIFSGTHIRSFDFLVYSHGPDNWLVLCRGNRPPTPARRTEMASWG